MIARRFIFGLGISQIIGWGISFYLIGVFGEYIAADLGWSLSLVHGGFSVALLAMGLVSPIVGRLIDQIGGRPVLGIGSALLASGCVWLSFIQSVTGYFCAWIVMGVAMRCTLYDAAFATVVRIAGAKSRKPISQITLFGGLAATFFWPIGHMLAEAQGWRGAMIVYAGLALATMVFHLTLPTERFADEEVAIPAPSEGAPQSKQLFWRAVLFVFIVTLGNAFHAGMSAHMIGILTQLGLGAALAVSVASVRGVGQSAGRLVEVVSGSRMNPIDLNILAAAILPIAFIVGLASGVSVAAAFGFSFAYGVGTGLLTITRGALPLVLFDPRSYGSFVGKLLVPGFLASAAAPFLFAVVIESYGAKGALYASIGLLFVLLAASVALKLVQLKEIRSGPPATK